jgi:hypothetical protein
MFWSKFIRRRSRVRVTGRYGLLPGTDELNASITRIAGQGEEAATAASENDVYSGQIETIGHKLKENVERFRV